MAADIPLTPDILTRLQNRPETTLIKKRTESTQFLLLLVMVTALLLSTLPLLIQQTNKMFGTASANQIIPALNPTPTPDSSLLFYINESN
jgi:hypothetical protein